VYKDNGREERCTVLGFGGRVRQFGGECAHSETRGTVTVIEVGWGEGPTANDRKSTNARNNKITPQQRKKKTQNNMKPVPMLLPQAT